MTKPDLKPCPFCGGQAKIMVGVSNYDSSWVQCEECNISTDCFKSLRQAVKAWNRRADD